MELMNKLFRRSIAYTACWSLLILATFAKAQQATASELPQAPTPQQGHAVEPAQAHLGGLQNYGSVSVNDTLPPQTVGEKFKMAAIDDGKNLDDRQPSDAKDTRRGRLHRARNSLRAAHDDVGKQEDNAAVRGLRDRALRHIDEALRLTEMGIANEEGAGPVAPLGAPPPPVLPGRPRPPAPRP